ncbi:ATP-binding protein [Bacillus thuringiensis]|uniref:ATP-binding protein n=1 Tax=Bacillus thuringiensis TaxID=1428 RepID=UPI0026E134C4|nr:ATP-binding protein [Bacillus thuringiensis]MDO6628847.1 ATP-binding protein [Bacillus thuringiensis]MDO6659233.1 ATP-binding protein [Bacillus thuringiensis]MDO6698815.1 ATP-binding protein [Bacillus thuringiensis]
MSLLNLKPQKPEVKLESYFITLLSKSKFGKTTFAYDLAQKHYDGDLSKMLILATEIGYKTLNGVYAQPIADFDYGDEDLETKGFIEIIDELIEEKANLPFKLIVIDTLTALEDLAEDYVLRTEGRRRGKKLSNIADIPFGGGYGMIASSIYKQIDRLRKAGFGVFVIGHEKIKKVEQRDGTSYDLTTLNVLGKTADIIQREADMIIYGDLVVENEGGNLVQKRYLRFRSDGNIICGSRFRNMPAAIEHSAEGFLETFEQAVLGSFGNDVEEMKKAEKEQEIKKEEEVAQYLETTKGSMNAQASIEWLKESISKLPNTDKAKLKPMFTEILGTMNYAASEDAEGLSKCVDAVKGLLGE